MSVTATFSQELRLSVSNKGLNKVLNTLNVEISFDDNALSYYTVSVSKSFESAEEAIKYLLKDKPFKMEKLGNVFLIIPHSPLEENEYPQVFTNKKYIISGELIDKSTKEPLPYAHIQIDRGVFLTNELGHFSILREVNKPVELQAQYMGYEILDTLLDIGSHKLFLTAQSITLEEVIVKTSSSSMFMQSGKTSGEIRINHQIAQYMPGGVDNSIFTLLRMMPGVRASGEPSDDLVVWGSNWGESRLMYDGFTIFGMKNFNDQISSVNPYVVKDIRLHKGGYDASYGGRIGAISEMTGKDGDFNKPSVKANISNYTVNLYTSIPIKKRSALSMAYRQTFYNLYDKERVDNANVNNEQQSPLETYIEPNYDFKDMNLKYVGKAFANDRFHISLYGADDNFKFFVKQQDYELDASEKNRQYGISSGYNRVWNKGSVSKLLFSSSKLSSAIDNISGIINDTTSAPLDLFFIKNTIQEISLKLEHSFNIGENQKIEIGGLWEQYRSEFNDDKTQINVPSLYIADNIMLGKLSLNIGLRSSFVNSRKVYLQPRLSARYSLSDELTATTSFGIYNQFLTRIPFLYSPSSYQMIWNLSDTTYLSSTHYLAGIAYSKNSWLISTEGYIKKNKNQRYYLDNSVLPIDNTIWGVDLYAKKEWGKHSFFGGYSLVNTLKPQESIGHEVKLGSIFSLNSFNISGTFVYGSGFPYLSTSAHGHGNDNEEGQHDNEYQHSDSSNEPYSRLDLSLTYNIKIKKLRMQVGISVLNVFNTTNVKYSYRLPDESSIYNIYAKATPFTPILFFNIR